MCCRAHCSFVRQNEKKIPKKTVKTDLNFGRKFNLLRSANGITSVKRKKNLFVCRSSRAFDRWHLMRFLIISWEHKPGNFDCSMCLFQLFTTSQSFACVAPKSSEVFGFPTKSGIWFRSIFLQLRFVFMLRIRTSSSKSSTVFGVFVDCVVQFVDNIDCSRLTNWHQQLINGQNVRTTRHLFTSYFSSEALLQTKITTSSSSSSTTTSTTIM